MPKLFYFGRLLPMALLCRDFLIGTLFAYVLVSLCLGGTRAARPAFYTCALLWSGALLLRRSWLYPLLHTTSRNNGLVCLLRWFKWSIINLVLTLVLAEVSVRAFALWTGTSWMLSDTLDAYRLAPGRDYGGGLRGNTLGYPGPDFRPDKPPGIRRIAALGDSFAVGPAVPFADNYLTLLEKELSGWQVCNFGVSGTGPREYHWILRQHVWQFQPDLVLVSIFVGNDITETLATPRHMDPRGHSFYLLLTRTGRLLRERRRHTIEAPEEPPCRLAAGTLSEQTFREVEARRLVVCQVPQPPDLEKKWTRCLSYLDRIVKDCQGRGVPVAFVLIPDEFQVDHTVLVEAMTARHTDEYSIDLELPQKRLRAFLAEWGAPCLDLLDAFRESTDTYARRDTHWNVRGNHLAAEHIVKWLRTLKDERINPPVFVPPPPAP